MNKPRRTLIDTCPEIYDYWDFEQNEKKPEEIGAGTKTYVMLFCKIHNKKYRRSADQITRQPCKCYCPECISEGMKRTKIHNGSIKLLKDKIPNICEYWIDEINKVRLELVCSNSHEKIRLYCKTHNFYFDKKPASLKPNEEICPICAGKLAPLYILYPECEEEYSEKNVFPFSQITAGSSMKAIWKCRVPGCNCEWVSTVNHYVNGYGRCPNERIHTKIKKIDPKNK
ncbi:MAG: zinc-ribbon domain-containing protein [Lachnospiraceae bacterium]|nr:zinc-ribbon domain-containing protein [Lachnospiraceae bacterium]